MSNKATVWWALYRYFPYLCGTFGPDSINQMQNSLTLETAARQYFGAFEFALEAEDGVNLLPLERLTLWLYLHSWRPGRHLYRVTPIVASIRDEAPPLPLDEIVSLASEDPEARAPSPGFLDVHAQVARILEVSGIGGEIQHNLQLSYPENIDPDGSTDLGDILSRQLLTGV